VFKIQAVEKVIWETFGSEVKAGQDSGKKPSSGKGR
jgi:hypothetical protein